MRTPARPRPCPSASRTAMLTTLLALSAAALSGCQATATPAAPTGAGGVAAPAVGPVAHGHGLVVSAASATQSQPQPPAGTCHVHRARDGAPLPDPACTPGATNPAVTPATLRSTICQVGWTKTVRPAYSVTRTEKSGSVLAYGLTSASYRTTEYDHLISLELGGAVNDERNLWPEPNDNPNATGTLNGKDIVESTLKRAVCAGKVPLGAAQRAIASDWTTALASLGVR